MPLFYLYLRVYAWLQALFETKTTSVVGRPALGTERCASIDAVTELPQI
jgi:hypothetical protein